VYSGAAGRYTSPAKKYAVKSLIKDPPAMNEQATPTSHAISVRGISKTYKDGFQPLKSIDLDIRRGEIF
jgi:ABC-type uncharacterized transport system ATPase subunit